MVTIWLGMLLTLIVVTLSVGGLLIIREKAEPSMFRRHHDVADPLLSVVGTLFAVLLGFMVANAMQRFQDAQLTTQQEANYVMDVYRLATGLPQPAQMKIKEAVFNYVATVVADEWPKMAMHRSSNLAWQYYCEIWNQTVAFKPSTEGENNLHAKILDCVTTFGDCRRQRVETLHNGLSPVLWTILLAGGAATICFTYFFGIENLRVQVIMTALVSLAICLNLFLLACFDDPFSGDVMIGSNAFDVDQRSFKMIESGGGQYETESPLESHQPVIKLRK